MAYTTPRTWVAAETVTAALMNTHVRDNIAYVHDNMVAAASPTFTGTVTAPTVNITTDLTASGTASTGTGAFVRAVSPTFTGTVTAATISASTITATGSITASDNLVATNGVQAGNYLRAGSMAIPVSNVNYGVVLTNVAGSPPNTPSGGGFLFVHNGALKFTGTAGTTTTIAPA